MNPKTGQWTKADLDTLNLLHVESEAEKSQIEVDIDIQKVAPKFNGTIQKNQSRYERKRQLYDAAQGIIRKLPS